LAGRKEAEARPILFRNMRNSRQLMQNR